MKMNKRKFLKSLSYLILMPMFLIRTNIFHSNIKIKKGWIFKQEDF